MARWDDDDICFVQDQYAQLYYKIGSFKKHSTDRHVAMLWHIILIPSQPVRFNYLMLYA
jgi:hypothetical protein